METLCRTCTVNIDTQNSSMSVFSDTQTGDTIASLLLKYCCLEITENDSLPKNICAACVEELLAFTNFHRKCEYSEQTFCQMLKETKFDVLIENNDIVEQKSTVETLKTELLLVNETDSNQLFPVDQQADGDVDKLQWCYNVIEMMSFRCCLCSGIFYSQEDHQEHIELAHGIVFPEVSNVQNQPVCFICLQAYASSEDLEVHQGKSLIELFQCNNCDDIYDTVDNVAQHYEQTHLASNDNENSFGSLEKLTEKPPLRKNISKMKASERYCCVTHCHECFPDEQHLISHAQKKHELKLKYNQEKNSSGKPYVCLVCFRSFGTMKNLKVHQFVRANNTQGKHFSCVHCSFRTVSRSLLTVHERSKHSGERPFKCCYCDKRFFSDLHLKNHMICHSSERPFSCSFCQKSFSRKRNMEEHIRSCHSEDKPYACDSCPARFKVPQHLRIHARIHSGEKPYKCSYCDNSYSHISDRKRHEMVHTGEKPYKCSSCEAAFTRKRTLKIHERTHSGERPFCCEICGKGFCQNATLKKHMERHVRIDEDVSVSVEMLADYDCS
ncbi:zinc finger protein 260-like [Topomyia yanbarensis]|uniref:zinc finger protein 260-like n=1 Tax=Topomyia yanbarensis TaxID=2498891 RepID=UPI00273BCD7E|nr:zinc finger protein 260-like [Topomyia yanbarensis]